MEGTGVSIERLATLKSLADILSFVDGACQRFGVTGSTAFDIRLAVEEVCTNVIEHGYAGREAGPVTITMEDEGKQIVIVIEDRGASFDPDSASEPDPTLAWAERQPGGLGVHLVKKVTDGLRYESSADGVNSMTLIKLKSQ